ncbi:OmpP1/FadL family transporter [Pseudooceanicola algae]|uniref:Uncharacterized protein n=1 Tax=Pseudooceanicola algae TaxID=1537215 RepID=A0A418SDV3_9RHOB|nr:outer membrane protein transport protein [Pseudooceanicola algae]QPM89534.1 hypothetical protein PSAL_007550 [Pseudooceanicola algae]
MNHVAAFAAAGIGVGIVAGLGATPAQAGGIERTTQSAMPLFEEGNKFTLSYGYAWPQVSGTTYAVGPFGAAGTGNVANNFALPGFSLKMDLDDRFALALIYDRPFGADVFYDLSNPVLGGTSAVSDTSALTALGKYKVTDNVSLFGGLRIQQSNGDITLQGAAYSTLSGYSVSLQDDTAYGYVLGAAYEIPDIAFRLALTYNSAIEHDFDTVENINPTVTTTTQTKTPSSWNLEFQTGIAEDTLLMASVRYVEHSEFVVKPASFYGLTGRSLVNLEDTTTYRIGVGRRFSDRIAGSAMLVYEPEGDPMVSPLAPKTGMTGIQLGMSYLVSDQVEISGGISYLMLGDATPQTGGSARADFADNSITAVGLKVTYSF